MNEPDFLWGVGTSAYQVEGAVEEDGRGRSIWDTFAHTPGKIRDGSTGDVACDQYHRYDQDIAMMQELGIRAYRFSIAWPRIQPEGSGRPDQRGLDHYRRLVHALRAHEITPLPTLYHWDLPQALEDAGGWVQRDTAQRFAEYASVVGEALADQIGPCITVNEPLVSAWLGYGIGGHAPGRTNEGEAFSATHHLLMAHGLGTQALRASGVHDVGIALNLYPVRSASEDPQDQRAAELADLYLNRQSLDPVFGRGYPAALLEQQATVIDLDVIHDGDLDVIDQQPDFLGVNYYTVHTVAGTVPARSSAIDVPPSLGIWSVSSPEDEVTSMGWPIEPGGLTEMLLRVHEEYGPARVYITENGAAFNDRMEADGAIHDDNRIAYLQAHIEALREAVRAGVPVVGYLAWSLLDNFEWGEGYTQRFGLVHVDFETMERTPKDSARWYGALARSGALVPLP